MGCSPWKSGPGDCGRTRSINFTLSRSCRLTQQFIINGLQHLLWRELLRHAPAKHMAVLKGLGPARHHLGLELGNVVLANLAVEGVEQHHLLAVEAVVLNKSPDRRRGTVEPHG